MSLTHGQVLANMCHSSRMHQAVGFPTSHSPGSEEFLETYLCQRPITQQNNGTPCQRRLLQPCVQFQSSVGGCRWLGWLVGLEVENRKLSEIGLDGVGGQHSTANSMQNCKTKKRKSGIRKYEN